MLDMMDEDLHQLIIHMMSSSSHYLSSRKKLLSYMPFVIRRSRAALIKIQTENNLVVRRTLCVD